MKFRALAGAAVVLLGACSDGPTRPIPLPVEPVAPVGPVVPVPASAVEVTLGGTTRAVGAGNNPITLTGLELQCSFDLSIAAGSQAGRAPVTFTGGTIQRYVGSEAPQSVPLSASNLAQLFGAPGLATGESRAGNLKQGAKGPFRMVLEVAYQAEGGITGSVRHEAFCELPSWALSGKYVLASVDGVPLPAPSASGYAMLADTLEFHSNLSYTASGRLRQSGRDFYMTSTPTSYFQIRGDSTFLTFAIGTAAGGPAVVREGSLLMSKNVSSTRPSEIWRFEKL